jgi:hypothetical protein
MARPILDSLPVTVRPPVKEPTRHSYTLDQADTYTADVTSWQEDVKRHEEDVARAARERRTFSAGDVITAAGDRSSLCEVWEAFCKMDTRRPTTYHALGKIAIVTAGGDANRVAVSIQRPPSGVADYDAYESFTHAPVLGHPAVDAFVRRCLSDAAYVEPTEQEEAVLRTAGQLALAKAPLVAVVIPDSMMAGTDSFTTARRLAAEFDSVVIVVPAGRVVGTLKLTPYKPRRHERPEVVPA